jgi:hypothetical protein
LTYCQKLKSSSQGHNGLKRNEKTGKLILISN